MTKLKKIRTERGFTQAQVAQMLKCSTTVYSRYETGDRQPSIDVLIALSGIFNVSIDYIVNNPHIADSSVADPSPDPIISAEAKQVIENICHLTDEQVHAVFSFTKYLTEN